MNIHLYTTPDNEIFYEIGDWGNALPMCELIHNFAELPKPGQDILIAAVIGHVIQGIFGADDERDINNIRERFNHLIKILNK